MNTLEYIAKTILGILLLPLILLMILFVGFLATVIIIPLFILSLIAWVFENV